MWLTVMRRWVRYRPAFQAIFILVFGIGMFLGMRPSPATTAEWSWLAVYMHAGGLFTCTILSYLGYPRWRWWSRGLLMFAAGIAVEVVQSFHPRRVADIDDIVANTAGVIIGLAAIKAWQVWSRRRNLQHLRATHPRHAQ